MATRVSRKVTIKNKISSGSLARVGQGLDIGEVLANNNLIGSGWNGRDVLRGLTFEEEEKYLPDLIGISPTNDKWSTETKSYWANISARIPYPDGLELEVGMIYPDDESAEKGIKEENSEADNYATARSEGKFYKERFNVRFKHGNPINVENYILWRYCLLYSDVANTPDEMYNSAKIRFYMTSADRIAFQQKKALKNRQKAYNLYLSILDDGSKIRNVFTLMSDEYRTVSLQDPTLPLDDRSNLEALTERIVNTYPTRFIEVVNDKQLNQKAFVERCINNGLLRRVPNTNTIIYGDNQILGENIPQVIDALNVDANKEIIQNLKARLTALES